MSLCARMYVAARVPVFCQRQIALLSLRRAGGGLWASEVHAMGKERVRAPAAGGAA